MEKVGKIVRDNLKAGIKKGLENNTGVFLLSYSAVSSAQMNTLRKDLKKLGADVLVSKNRIAKIALQELKREKLAEQVNGQTAFVWGNADSTEISKTLLKFIKQCEGVVIRGGVVEGNLLQKEDIKRLADLPSRDVLRSQLLQVMLSPLTRLAGALNAKSIDLLSILKQLSEKKGGS